MVNEAKGRRERPFFKEIRRRGKKTSSCITQSTKQLKLHQNSFVGKPMKNPNEKSPNKFRHKFTFRKLFALIVRAKEREREREIKRARMAKISAKIIL